MLFILIHLLICIVIAILLFRETWHMKWYLFPVVLFVPVVGPMLFFMEAWNLEHGVSKKTLEAESFKIKEVRYKRINVDEGTDNDMVVPLEEAIALNSSGIQRKLMMQVLQDNPTGKVELLQKASLAPDTELTHYATTTIMMIQGDYEKSIRDLDKQLEKTPDNVSVLRKLRTVLKNYIASGLISGTILGIYREKLLNTLNKLLKSNPDYTSYLVDKGELLLEDDKYEETEKVVSELLRQKAADERVVKLAMNYYKKTHQGEQLKELARTTLSNGAYYPVQFKEQLEFYL